jgi:hypothetical protein
MAKVAIVENGAVVYRGVLPRVWKNSSGLHNSRDDWPTLLELGIYPLEEHMPSLDLDTETLDGWTEDIQSDKVVLTNKKRDKTDAEVAADVASAAKAYIWKREREYPKIEEQLDKIYHDGIDEWKKVIKAVKDKYPKPE